jgi:glutathione S-transferase
MGDLILHHYAMSPYAQKVRLVLGFKRLAWRSVIVPVMLPKPDAVALTGGYRRTPFMQVGADVYCDTALICRVIDALHPEPTIYPAAVVGLADIVAQWADTTLWWAAIPFTMQPAGIVHVMAGATADMLKAFGADRAAMTPNMRRATLADGAAALHTGLARLEHLLADGRPFLLGALPCITDFSAAQSLWFMHLAPPIAASLAAYPHLGNWYRRVDAFGQGVPTPQTSAEAIALARAADGVHAPCTFTPEPGLEAAGMVTVTPTDYAHDPVAGALVGLSRDEVVVERHDERAGRVHVHFPRLGYQIRPQTP